MIDNSGHHYDRAKFKDPTASKAIKNVIGGRKAKNNGKQFEKIVDLSCEYYLNKNLAYIQKTPEPARFVKPLQGGKFVAYYEKSAQVDYKGLIRGGRSISFDAKHTSDTRIEFSQLQPQQEKQLLKEFELGGIAFVLISFSRKAFYAVPIDEWTSLKTTLGKKSANQKDLERYQVSTKGNFVMFLEADR